MMNRVKTLAENLLAQVNDNAAPTELLSTVQMLMAEIANINVTAVESANKGLAAVYVQKIFLSPAAEQKLELALETEEKSVEILQVDEAEILAELDEIKKNANERSALATHNKPDYHFDPVEEIPTLAQQQTQTLRADSEVMPAHHQAYVPSPLEAKSPAKELHITMGEDASPSLNDKLKQSTAELSDSLKDAPIKDLKKGIGINDRFLYINELFRGDETMYERSIKTINSFAIYPEAEYWIKRELKLKLVWDDKNAVVKAFDQLVRRRFS